MSGSEQTILVTGGTSGLGYHTTVNLTMQYPDATIVVASRKDPHAVIPSIRQLTGHKKVHFVPLDLGNQRSVRTFVETFSERGFPSISILILNAALQFGEKVTYTSDGIEASFGVNHVGHALLFHLLQPYLADRARIVLTASATHDPAQKTGSPEAKYTFAEELAHPSGDALKNNGLQRYGTSKLCNVLWMYALHRRMTCLANKSWTTVCFDPGMMPGTGLAREAGPVFRFIWKSVMPKLVPLLRRVIPFRVWTPEESGANLAWVASHETTSGVYYDARKQIKSSVDSYDEAKQEELWKWTIQTVASSAKEQKEFDMV